MYVLFMKYHQARISQGFVIFRHNGFAGKKDLKKIKCVSFS